MAQGEARPLAGRRIVVTRAREQADELAERLESLSAEVIFMPMVRFLDPDDTRELDRTIGELGEFAWLVFTSANATRFFLKRCRLLRQWPDPEDGPRIAAVGTATRAAVDAQNLRVTLMPKEANGATLAAALAPHAAGKKMLLPRSDLASRELPDALRAAGAAVTEVVAYRTASAEGMDATTRAMLLGNEMDAVTFFSPSAFHNFVSALGGAEAARKLGERAMFAAVGPVTAAAIREAGIATLEASEASSAAVADALERHFAEQPARPGPGERKGIDHVSH